MTWRKTDWRFITSQGGAVTGGEVLQIGGTGGSFFLENNRTHNRIELVYGALGVGVGAGIPINISGSTRDMPSGGIGQIMAKNSSRLYPEDFTGLFVMGSLQYSAVDHGRSISFVFFNIPPMKLLFGDDRAWNLESAKAQGQIWATSAGVELGLGAMYFCGYLSLV